MGNKARKAYRRSGYFSDRGSWVGKRNNLIAQILAGSIRARLQLYEMYSYIAERQARQFSRVASLYGVEWEDLLQEAYAALLEAVLKLDVSKPRDLVANLTYKTRQGLENYLTRQGRQPVLMTPQVNTVVRVLKDLLDCVLSDQTSIPKEVRDVLQELRDNPVFSDEMQFLTDLAAWSGDIEYGELEFEREDDGEYIQEEYAQQFGTKDLAGQAGHEQLEALVTETLSTLTFRERTVIRLRFGLEGEKPHTLNEVARMFNVTRERIRQIEAKALRKLRHPTRLKRLEDFLA